MKVKFVPLDIELEIDPNQSVMELAHKNGIFIKSVCNGVPNCAECRVKIVEGEHNVLPPSSKELQLIGSGHFIDRRRLSCQLHCFGDVVIDVEEQVKKEGEGPPGSRRFQVELRNEGIVSKAVTGNLIEQDLDLVEQVSQGMETGSGRGGDSGGAKADTILNLTKESSGGKKANRNRNRRSGKDRKKRAEGTGKPEARAKSKSGESGGKNKEGSSAGGRNRRRRRPKKSQGAPGGKNASKE
jgi:2Fe-2S ferredoxin